MEEKNTAFVLNELNKAPTHGQGLNLVNDDSMGFKDMSFSDFFNNYLASHPEIKPADVVRDSGLTRQYFSQIVNGQKNAGRDKIIAICFAARMNTDETNHALMHAKHSHLYVKDRRDGFLYNEIRWHNIGKSDRKNVTELNLFLTERGFPPLDV